MDTIVFLCLFLALVIISTFALVYSAPTGSRSRRTSATPVWMNPCDGSVSYSHGDQDGHFTSVVTQGDAEGTIMKLADELDHLRKTFSDLQDAYVSYLLTLKHRAKS